VSYQNVVDLKVGGMPLAFALHTGTLILLAGVIVVLAEAIKVVALERLLTHAWFGGAS
jgi:hypothetical protein